MAKPVAVPYRRAWHPGGYVLIYVGVRHHLADKAGWAFEHRVVAEEMLRRRLKPGEVVHHEDRDRANNDPANLIVFPSTRHHNWHHRRTDAPRRAPDQENELIDCACGCGERRWRFNPYGEERKFIHGHAVRARPRKPKRPRVGTGFVNRSKTHCLRGHEFSEKNTRIGKRGERICRACKSWHENKRRKNG